MDRVIFIGDLHGDWEAIPDFITKYDIKNTTFIQVGDFGIGFDGAIKDEHRLVKLNFPLVKTENELLIIRGNHDDPQYWNNAEDWNKRNIEFVPDFTVKEINFMKYFFVGGGVSIDRSVRNPGTSYWFDEGIVICPNPPKNIDVMVTHVPYPHIFNPDMGNLYYWINRDSNLEEQLKIENMKLMRMGEEVKPNYWFSGHFHMSKTVWNNGIKHTTLGVNEFKEFEI